jgi:mRNA interferase YafQ
MLLIDITGQFKRDYKREKAGRHSDLDKVFKAVTTLLTNGKPLPVATKDHPLKGEWSGCRDCHLKPDLVLIYRKSKTAIELLRIGSHSELYG